jgi:hypothetical protein
MWHITQANDFNLGKSFMTLGCLKREIKKFVFFLHKKTHAPLIFLGIGIDLKKLTGIFEF